MATLMGRRRWLPELQSSNFNLRSFGERVALNMPIQGTAADVMKIAMIRVDQRLRAEGSRPGSSSRSTTNTSWSAPQRRRPRSRPFSARRWRPPDSLPSPSSPMPLPAAAGRKRKAKNLSKKASLFRHRGLRPAASHELRTCGPQFPRLQAEQCFPARACRAGKRIRLYFATAVAKLYEVLIRLSLAVRGKGLDKLYFCIFPRKRRKIYEL